MARQIRALRGATTLERDAKDQVMERTAEMVRTLMERNAVERSDIVSLLFTATEDIRSEFPAAAARAIGISDVPLLCARELEVDGAVRLCIRVMMHLYTERSPSELRHVYLHGAEMLRLDLPR